MTVQTKPYTLEEYLILEEQAEYKNEYLNGEIIPMTGAQPLITKLPKSIRCP
jgi:Uma2 family endonuclease